MEKLLLLGLVQIINNEELQDKAVAIVAGVLADVLPDVTEDALGMFLEKLGRLLTEINP